MVMNCDAGATIALLLLMTTDATLFTAKYTKTVTKHLPHLIISSSHLISTFVFGCVLSAHNKRICYVMAGDVRPVGLSQGRVLVEGFIRL